MKVKASHYSKAILVFTIIASLVFILFRPFSVSAEENDEKSFTFSNYYEGEEFLSTRDLYIIAGDGPSKPTPLREADMEYNEANPGNHCGLYASAPYDSDNGYYPYLFVYYNTTGDYIEILYPYGACKSPFVYETATSSTTKITVPITVPENNSFTYDYVDYEFQRIFAPSESSWEDLDLLGAIPHYATRAEVMESIGTFEVADVKDGAVKVTAKIKVSYIVEMPAVIEIEPIEITEYGETVVVYGSEYKIGAKGYLAPNAVLNVVPADTFTLLYVGSALEMTGLVQQTKTQFAMGTPKPWQEPLDHSHYNYVEGKVAIPDPVAGYWSGNLTFTFSVTGGGVY